MNKKIRIGLLLSICSLALIIAWNVKPKQEAAETDLQHPGWYEHYLELKGDKNGEIPAGMAIDWMQADRTILSKNKKTENDLENIKEIGPNNVGGRTRSIVVDYSNPDRFLCAGVSGGVWVSNDKGSSWNIIDDFAPTLSATSITQSPFNHDLFYYGSGEPMGNSADIRGMGLFRSTDGAISFDHLEHTATNDFSGIWDVEHSLTKDSTIYVATHTSGVWRSTNAGASFEKIYTTGRRVHEIEVKEDSTILIAVSGHGIVEINENTLTATDMKGGDWPANGYSRISFDYSKNFPEVMYAQVSGSDQQSIEGLYKTSNGGETWTQITTPSWMDFTYSWYCFKMSTAPADSNFVMCTSTTRPSYSNDGGITWQQMANSHADYHEITWINDNLFLIGNDGGVYRMNKSFMELYTNLNNGLNITQFYAGGYYPTSESIIGGTQDNGTRFSLEASSGFSRAFHSDGGFCAVNQQDDDIRYVSTQNMNIYRQEASGSVHISNFIRNRVGGNNGVWFINPFEVNMLDGNQIYVPTRQETYRSLDGGRTWVTLTGSTSGDAYSVGISNDINPTIYIGGTGSFIYRIDSAATAEPGSEIPLWTGQKLPPSSFFGGVIACVEVDPTDKGTIYVAMSNIDDDSRIWRIRDADTDNPIWDDLGAGLPQGMPINWVEVDPLYTHHLLIGTEYGMYTSMNNGASWNKETRIPNTAIDQLRLRASDRKLFIYTHGRGIWTADLTDNPVASAPQEKLESRFTIYPNPANAFIQVKGNFDTFTLYNSAGAEVKNGAQRTIDVQDLAPGTYFIELSSEGTSTIEKVLISK